MGSSARAASRPRLLTTPLTTRVAAVLGRGPEPQSVIEGLNRREAGGV
jgi:hypothetical protein